MMCIGSNEATVPFTKKELEVLYTLCSEKLREMECDIDSQDNHEYVRFKQIEAKIDAYIFLIEEKGKCNVINNSKDISNE